MSEDPMYEHGLDHLLSPVSSEEFLERYWEKEHLLIQDRPADHYGDLFSFADVDRYLRVAANNPAARMSVLGDGGPMRKVPVRGAEIGDLYRAFDGGATVMLDSIDRSWPPAAALVESLSAALGAAVKVNVYMTPPGRQGAPLHPDIQDVLVLQLAGR